MYYRNLQYYILLTGYNPGFADLRNLVGSATNSGTETIRSEQSGIDEGGKTTVDSDNNNKNNNNADI